MLATCAFHCGGHGFDSDHDLLVGNNDIVRTSVRVVDGARCAIAGARHAASWSEHGSGWSAVRRWRGNGAGWAQQWMGEPRGMRWGARRGRHMTRSNMWWVKAMRWYFWEKRWDRDAESKQTCWTGTRRPESGVRSWALPFHKSTSIYAYPLSRRNANHERTVVLGERV
jgi:hypothetical protein